MNTPQADGDDVGLDTSGADVSLAAIRADDLAERRRQDRWNLDRRREATTVCSALQNAKGNRLTVHLIVGDAVVGHVAETGMDYVAIESSSGLTWIARHAIIAVAGPGELAADPESVEPKDTMMIDVLEDLLATESRLSITLAGGFSLLCQPISVGSSLTVRNLANSSTVVIDLAAISTLRRVL